MRREVALSRRIAATLEEGRASGAMARLAERLAAPWAEHARVVAPLVWQAPSRALVTVGGATLGGDGKTRLALACARWLAEHAEGSARVALVGHGFRATPGHARVVRADDAVSRVGDEAVVLARRLGDLGLGDRVPVIVAPERAAAVALAFLHADVVVLDGTLQVAPVPATLAVLVQAAEQPWGKTGHCPPRGDLRAARERLLAASDLQVQLPDAEPDVALSGEPLVSLAAFARTSATLRIGLFTALARPGRIVARLAREEIAPVVHLEAPDHASGRADVVAGLARLARLHRLDLWLATDKCAAGLTFEEDGSLAGVPLAQLVPRGETLPSALVSRLSALMTARAQ